MHAMAKACLSNRHTTRDVAYAGEIPSGAATRGEGGATGEGRLFGE